jgi:polar amino acid transport system substrate-binding protein
MEYIDKQGSLAGFDVDLGYRIAYEIGAKAEIEDIPWAKLFTSLSDKKIDMIMSSVTITDQRKQLYDFSDPYISNGQIIISRKNSPITSLEQLQGKKISVESGTTNQLQALKYTSAKLVIGYSDLIQAAKALSEGKVDAMICDETLAKGLTGEYSNLEVTSEPFTNEYYGIVYRKDEQGLEDKVNKALTILQVNGYLSDLKQEWIE